MKKIIKRKKKTNELFLSLLIVLLLCSGIIAISYSQSPQEYNGLLSGIKSIFKLLMGGMTSNFAIGGANGYYYYYGGCPKCSITVYKYNDLDGDGDKGNGENYIVSSSFAITSHTDLAIEDDKLQLTDNTGKTEFEYDCPLAPGKHVFIGEDLTIGAAPHPGWINTGIGPDNPVTCLCPDECSHTVYVGNQQSTDVSDEKAIDLGDAPDSSNNWYFWKTIGNSMADGVNTDMTAYPKGGPLGILADFPTVINPAAANGTSQGPCHVYNTTGFPKLGINITNDWNDADVMPDDDNVPNINVTADLPDLDLADDGLINISVNISPADNCGTGNISFSVTGTFTETYYFNAWVDFNRDGDWADSITACAQTVSEWIIKNMTITGPGTYYNNTWLAYIPDSNYRWLRMTLHPEIDFFGTPVGTAITNCTGLQAMDNDLSGDYYLANDIDCSDTVNWNIDDNCSDYTDYSSCNSAEGCGWYYLLNGSGYTGICIDNMGFTPIAKDYPNEFTGTFDGRGHTITGLYINKAGNAALFGRVDTSAVIKNVGLLDVNITGGSNVAALVSGMQGGEVINCYSTGNVEQRGWGYGAGGLVASNSGTIKDSYSTVNVIADRYDDSSDAGGLAGSNSAIINRSYATGDVTALGGRVGGLVGANSNINGIIDSFATGSVSGVENLSNGIGVGGLLGTDYSGSGSINSSYWHNFSGNPSKCTGYPAGNTGCTANDTESYFYSSSNAPMTIWDFNNIWQENTNDYPNLRLFYANSMMNYDGSGPGYCFIGGETEDYYEIMTVEYFEICDGQDNDNDGLSDEGFDGDNDGDYDDDDDGWGDLCDNCPDDYNPDQVDICSPVVRGAGGAGRRSSLCAENWSCSDWGPCFSDGKQYRTCFDLNNCDELYNKNIVLHINRLVKPDEVQDCEYQPKCYDDIFNGNESDVDCGGLICPKCEDGKRCRVDEDCINLCNQTAKICYTPVRMPQKIRPPLALIIGMAGAILLILEALTYGYQKAFVLAQIELYKKRRAMSRRKSRGK